MDGTAQHESSFLLSSRRARRVLSVGLLVDTHDGAQCARDGGYILAGVFLLAGGVAVRAAQAVDAAGGGDLCLGTVVSGYRIGNGVVCLVAQ